MPKVTIEVDGDTSALEAKIAAALQNATIKPGGSIATAGGDPQQVAYATQQASNNLYSQQAQQQQVGFGRDMPGASIKFDVSQAMAQAKAIRAELERPIQLNLVGGGGSVPTAGGGAAAAAAVAEQMGLTGSAAQTFVNQATSVPASVASQIASASTAPGTAANAYFAQPLGAGIGSGVDPAVARRVDRNFDQAAFAQYKQEQRGSTDAQRSLSSELADARSRGSQLFNIQSRQRDYLEEQAQSANASDETEQIRRNGSSIYGPLPAAGFRPLNIPQPEEESKKRGRRYPFRQTIGIAALGLHEINRALSALDEGEFSALQANTPEAAQLARAQALQQASSGFFGSLVTAIPNLTGASFSPNAILTDARLANYSREQADADRNAHFDADAGQAYRSAYARGGDTAGELARLRVEQLRRNDGPNGFNPQIKTIRAQLAERVEYQVTGPSPAGIAFGGEGLAPAIVSPSAGGLVRTYSDFKLTGAARGGKHAELDRLLTEQTEADRGDVFKSESLQRQLDAQKFSIESAIRRATAVSRGTTTYASQRQAIRDKFDEDKLLTGDLDLQGRLDSRRDAALGEQDSLFRRSSSDRAESLYFSGNQAILRSQGRSQQAAINQIGFNAFQQGREVLRQGGPISDQFRSLFAVGVNAIGQVTEANANYAFNTGQAEIGLGGRLAASTALLNRDSLEAQIAQIRAREKQERAAVHNQYGDTQQGRTFDSSIHAIADNEEKLATRKNAEDRADYTRGLDFSIRQTRHRIAGPDEYNQAEAEGIVNDADQQYRQRFRAGGANTDSDLAKIRDLGRLRLDEAKAQYERASHFEEVSPLRAFASGDLGKRIQAFDDAKKSIDNTGSGEVQGGAMTADGKAIVEWLSKIFDKLGLPSSWN